MSEEEILKECNQLFVTMVNCHINGKPMADLLALYEQEKEKNKELEKDNIDLKEKNRFIAENLSKSYIDKYKIKEKIEELEKELKEFQELDFISEAAKRYQQIQVLNDILEV